MAEMKELFGKAIIAPAIVALIATGYYAGSFSTGASNLSVKSVPLLPYVFYSIGAVVIAFFISFGLMFIIEKLAGD